MSETTRAEIGAAKKKPDLPWYQSTMGIIGLAALLVAILFTWYSSLCSKSHCNLEIVAHRDFVRYFGLKNDYFGVWEAEKLTREQLEYFLFLPTQIHERLKHGLNFCMSARRGAGKTYFRKYHEYNMETGNYFKVPLYETIEKYFVAFEDSFKRLGPKDETEIFNHWTSEQFMQVILTDLVTTFVNAYGTAKWPSKPFSTLLSKNERLHLALILSFYYNDHVITSLEDVINDLLADMFRDTCKLSNCALSVQKIEHQDPFPLFGGFQDKPLYTQLKALHESIRVKHYMNVPQLNLKLTLGIIEKVGALGIELKENPGEHLKRVSSFIKNTWNASPVLILDALDESRFFIKNGSINTVAFNKFIASALDKSITRYTYNNVFQMVLFFPMVKDLVISEHMDRHKFIPVNLTWSASDLILYADNALDKMRAQQKCACQVLPSFHGLLNLQTNPALNKFVLNSLGDDNIIRHPREMNMFMNYLISKIRIDAKERGFSSTDANVRESIETVKQQRIHDPK